MRSTKIVATIGPASRDPDTLERMIRAGMDVARLNFAHETPDEHAATVKMIREAASRVGREVAVLQDLPGPKLRIGPVEGGVTELGTGTTVVLTPEPIEGNSERAPGRLGRAVRDHAPGRHRLSRGWCNSPARRRRCAAAEVVTAVEVGGTLASRQGLNLPNVTTSLPAVSEEDLRLIDAGVDMGVDLLALSFVRRREDIDPVHERLRDRGRDIPVIAKIEKPQAAANADEIVRAAQGIMVARGDLGIELRIEEVPLVQKHLLQLAGRYAKPAITATQMLESMVNSSRPTRAEVTDVANAIFDGTDAVMLSQETAVGRYPVEAVAMMASIAETTERELPYGRWLTERASPDGDEAATIAFGAAGAVYQLDLKAIVVPTITGRTAALISAHRPPVPILALSPRIDVVRRLSLLWGVRAELNEEPTGTTQLIDSCAEAALRMGVAKPGERIGITAGLPTGLAGGTNLFKVHTF